MLLANQIAGFLSFKVDFLHVGTYFSKLQIDDMALGGCGQACSGMTKEATKN